MVERQEREEEQEEMKESRERRQKEREGDINAERNDGEDTANEEWQH